MSNIEKSTVEARLSHVSARLSEITALMQTASKSANVLVVELQCEIEDIYISMDGDDDSTQIESRKSDG